METINTADKPDDRLLAKYLHNEASENEQKVVNKWKDLSDENLQELQRCKVILKNSCLVFHMKHFNTDSAWKSIRERIKSVKTESYKQKVENNENY